MTNQPIFEIGVSPPDASFKWGFPIGGNWSASAIQVIEVYANRKVSLNERLAFEVSNQKDQLNILLQTLRNHDIEPVLDYQTVKNPTLVDVHSVGWYAGCVNKQSNGFFAGDMFENQQICGLSKPSPVMGHDAGCGIRKKQLRKLKISHPKLIKKADVIVPYIDPLVPAWQVLVVSARFRDCLLNSDFSGFEFFPISELRATSEESLLCNGPSSSDSRDWFQWVITGRTRPIPIKDFIFSRERCQYCNRSVGHAQPYYLSQPLPIKFFDADVQVCEELSLADGSYIKSDQDHLIVNSRFVELCVKEKFVGFTGLNGNSACFNAIYSGHRF